RQLPPTSHWLRLRVAMKLRRAGSEPKFQVFVVATARQASDSEHCVALRRARVFPLSVSSPGRDAGCACWKMEGAVLPPWQRERDLAECADDRRHRHQNLLSWNLSERGRPTGRLRVSCFAISVLALRELWVATRQYGWRYRVTCEPTDFCEGLDRD